VRRKITITDSCALSSTVKLFKKKKANVDPLLDAERKNDITRHNKYAEKNRWNV